MWVLVTYTVTLEMIFDIYTHKIHNTCMDIYMRELVRVEEMERGLGGGGGGGGARRPGLALGLEQFYLK